MNNVVDLTFILVVSIVISLSSYDGIVYVGQYGNSAFNYPSLQDCCYIGGHEKARHNLGVLEETDMDRRTKHLMIAASAGYDKSLEQCLRDGTVTNDDYRKTQEAFESSQAEMKSGQRTTAANVFQV